MIEGTIDVDCAADEYVEVGCVVIISVEEEKLVGEAGPVVGGTEVVVCASLVGVSDAFIADSSVGWAKLEAACTPSSTEVDVD